MNANLGDFDRQLTHWINFRNSHMLVPVIVQSFMVLCAVLIVLGLVYVIILVIAIAIHHVLFDRDPRKVPDYVKNSIQFSSESDMSETEPEDDFDDGATLISPVEESGRAKRIANLDKFLGQDDIKSMAGDRM